jgi:hypothetical protein
MGISNEVLIIIQALLAVIGWFVKRDLTTILREVRKTNGNVIRLDQSLKDHDKLDDERFDNLEKRLDKM